jgi:hypothetical protein
MSKRQTLARLQTVRTRVRDVAAAKAAEAARVVAEAHQMVQAAEGAFQAKTEMPPITSTRAADWLGFADELMLLKAHIEVTRSERGVAQQKEGLARRELAEKERSLRTCERQLEMVRAEILDRQLTAEQKLADDLSGSRSK